MTTAIAKAEMGTEWDSRAGDATFKRTNEERRQASNSMHEKTGTTAGDRKEVRDSLAKAEPRQDSLHTDTKHAMATS